MSSPLAWFGLADDADEREIKRAYARRLKTTRPDEDPAGFQQLHDMYQRALAWQQQQPSVAQLAAATDAPTRESLAAGQRSASAAVAPLAAVVPPGDADGAPSPEQVDHPPLATPGLPAAAPRPTLPTPRGGAWHPVQFDTPVVEAELEPVRFDTDRFVADFIDVAVDGGAEIVARWLHGRHELWSLHLKHEAGRALLQRLFRDPPAIRMSSFDATLQFFGLDHALTGIDPLQMRQLRQAMQERFALLQRFDSKMHAWGANRLQLDLSAFFSWFCDQALEGDSERMAAVLHAQPALRSLAVRQKAASHLLDRLLRECPPMPQDCAGLLLNFFGLAALAAQRGENLGERVAHLHMKWLMLPRNAGKLTLQVKQPQERFGDPRKAARHLHCMQRPFQWWWITLAALVPKLPSALGLFAWRLSGGVPSRLDDFFDPRVTRFWIAAADRTRLAIPRLFVGAVRCIALLLVGAGLQLWLLRSPPASMAAGDTWLPLMLSGGITLGWLYYIGFSALLLWQQRPEEPVQPCPLLRMGLLPLLVTAGLLLCLGFDQLIAGQALLLSAAVLANLRYLRRNPRQKQPSKFTSGLALLYILGIAAWAALRYPALSAIFALSYWLADLIGQRKQLRFRYRAAAKGTDPSPPASAETN
ncbi:hypothetical protein [Dyella sp. Tek66A03]|uniref:hypothetical protein n=1 Tax=Dyella sp. Tek66A03 TaxID=3458298 RepID=UPI00403E3E2B